MPHLKVKYFAALREQRGVAEEFLATKAHSPSILYAELQALYSLTLPLSVLRVAVNDEFSSMDQGLKDGDVVAFIAPVAGG